MYISWKIALALLLALAAFMITVGAGFDFTLGIFGNANMDDTIDEKDVSYVEGVIKGTNEATNLSDANYDGKVDLQDIDQINKIIRGEQNELIITDSEKKVSKINYPAKRAVLLMAYAAEAIRILGAQNTVVGVSNSIIKDDVDFPEFSKVVDAGSPADYEVILGLHPDIVIADVSHNAAEHAKNLPGIAVVSLPLWRPNDFREELLKTGYLFDKVEEAKHYIRDFHDKYLDSIKAKTKNLTDDERPKVYVGGSSGKDLYVGFGAKSGAQQMIDLCGGRNILADDDIGTADIDPEEILNKDPDIIIRYIKPDDAGCRYDDPSKIKALWEDTVNRPELANVTAIKKKEVYIVDNSLNYGLDYPVAMAYWAKWLHPELFKDLDPQSIHQEYLTEYQGLDFDVSKHGIFVYHPDLYPDGR
jgi:iron complex transport system substrate-binding protein